MGTELTLRVVLPAHGAQAENPQAEMESPPSVTVPRVSETCSDTELGGNTQPCSGIAPDVLLLAPLEVSGNDDCAGTFGTDSTEELATTARFLFEGARRRLLREKSEIRLEA